MELNEFKGVVVGTDDTITTRSFKELRDLQGAVNGLLEHVVIDDDVHVYVNEEGLMMDLPVNLTIEWWLNQRTGPRPESQFWLRGPAIVFGGFVDGYEQDVKPGIFEELEKSRPELLRYPDSDEI